MCTVSMVADHYRERWEPVIHPAGQPILSPQQPNIVHVHPNLFTLSPAVTRAEFDQLRQEVLELREMLIAAKRIDAATGQPDCEMTEKIDVLRRIAKLVGLSIDDIFTPTA